MVNYYVLKFYYVPIVKITAAYTFIQMCTDNLVLQKVLSNGGLTNDGPQKMVIVFSYHFSEIAF